MRTPFLIAHQALGAQILQAQSALGPALFYLSPFGIHGSEAKGPARGGVPVLFPQFADQGPLLKHGWARHRQWTLRSEQADGEHHTLQYELRVAAGDEPTWPHACDLTLTLQTKVDSLTLRLVVQNTGSEAFDWTGGLHPYFAITDAPSAGVSGLSGLSVQDRYDPNLHIQPAGELGLNGLPLERLFTTAPPLSLRTGAHTLAISTQGFDQWMLWNPGRTEALAMIDLPNEDWQRFICIEPVCVSRPVSLAVNERFVGQLDVQVIR